ncbi:MAG TPA: bifunctional riboflavin kinase/FMN adenylyltransferase [Phycisphaerales bacterium]|nr:bifunctional riboflavin kinase/FMN adenylyltransferase [Phycisphaerales bacterium]
MSTPATSVLTIGTFDGVHIGHQSLVRRAREVADRQPGARVVALVFKPNPVEILRPEAAPPRLSTFEQRRAWIVAAGADEVVRLEPTRELLSETPEGFVRFCVERFNPIAIVEGDDFRFGRARAGNVGVLAELGRRFNFAAVVVPTVSVSLMDHQYVHARSTVVRWLLEGGRVRDAAIVLSRPYELAGTVVAGDRRGRTIGFPTANLDVPTMIPADGVYAARAELPDGRSLAAAVSIGTKPTFGANARAVEAFVLRPGARDRSWVPLDGLPEYGWTLRLHMLAWVREQVKFLSLPPLLDQMDRDCTRCGEILRAEADRPSIPSDGRIVTATARPSEDALA